MSCSMVPIHCTCAYIWIEAGKGLMDAKGALLTAVGINTNCQMNVKVYFKIACVHI